MEPSQPAWLPDLELPEEPGSDCPEGPLTVPHWVRWGLLVAGLTSPCCGDYSPHFNHAFLILYFLDRGLTCGPCVQNCWFNLDTDEWTHRNGTE